MMKKFEKRLLSLVLAVLMAMSVFAVSASADSERHTASILLEDLGVEIYMIKDVVEIPDNGGNNSSYFVNNGDSYQFKGLSSGGCGDPSKYTGVIENITDAEITVGFDYTYDGSQFLISKSFNYTAASQIKLVTYDGDKEDYNVTLAAGERLYITILYSENENSSIQTTFTISNLHRVTTSEHALTVRACEGGSVSYDAETISVATGDKTFMVFPQEEITLTATPASGYSFVGFVNPDTNAVISVGSSYTFSISKDYLISARFVRQGEEIYRSGSLSAGYYLYDNFADAAQAAANVNGMFIPMQDFALPAGDYVVPETATLLIPFDDDGTCYTSVPANVQDVNAAKNPRPYRIFTMDNGAHITVNGAISVSAKHFAASTNAPAGMTAIAGYYGQIDMKDGSSIDVKNGANLYAWGFITGDFTDGSYGSYVNTEAGASIYELFQICDWRGGTATSNITGSDKRIFPFSQYYVQNIETNLVCVKGAAVKIYGSLIAAEKLGSASASLMGDDGLFVISGDDATITKYYNPVEDRLYVIMDGADGQVDANLATVLSDAVASSSAGNTANPTYTTTDFTLGKIILNISIPGLTSYTLNSSDFTLPINNMSVGIDNAVVLVENELGILPDSKLSVGQNARIALANFTKKVTTTNAAGNTVVTQKAEPASIYIIDAADWKAADPVNSSQGFASAEKSISQIYYSPSRDKNGSKRTAIRNSNKMKDAEMDINGQILSIGNYNTGKSGVSTTGSGAAIYSSLGTGQIMFFADASKADSVYAWKQSNGAEVDMNASAALLMNSDGTYSSSEARELSTFDVSPNLKEALLERSAAMAQASGMPASLASYIYSSKFASSFKCDRYYLKQDSNGVSRWYRNKVLSDSEIDYVPATTFLNYDGTELYKGWASYNTAPDYYGAVPTKPADAEGNYAFDTWSPSIGDAITTDTTYTAQFTKSTAYFKVTWLNADGTKLAEEELPYGSVPAYNGAEPTKAQTAQYTYTFAGWDKAITAITADVTYTATYTSTLRNYTVKWLNYDGAVLEQDTVPYGTTPIYDGTTPTRPETDACTYVFKGWNKTITTVTGNTNYTATYNEIAKTFTVKWLNYNGSVLEEDTVAYGVLPTYDGDTPARPTTAAGSYTFKGWDKPIAAVTADVTYKAEFDYTPRSYTVKFVNYDGAVLQETVYTYGDTPAYSGTDPIKPASDTATYSFSGWDKPIASVTGDTTYTAVFSENLKTYTIKWVDDDGTLFKSEELLPGETPSYDFIPANKPADQAGYSKVFTGWNPAIAPAAADTTYTAQYERSANGYFTAHSLTLKGMIGLNFFVKVSKDQAANYKVIFNDGRNTTEVVVADFSYDNDLKAFKVQVPVCAPDMTDNVSARLIDADNKTVALDNYKVSTYADSAFDHDDSIFDANLKNIVRSMLTYGAETQAYFGHHTNDLASDHLDAPVAYDDITVTEIEERISAANPETYATNTDSLMFRASLSGFGLEYAGKSLVLNSGTVLRHYFKIKDASKFEGTEVTFNGKPVETGYAEDGKIYFECAIAAAELDDYQTLTVGTLDIRCSALDYVKQAYSDSSTDAALLKVLKAVYWYNVNAEAYFG